MNKAGHERKRIGAVTVEFAFVAIILGILVGGIFELCRAFMAKQALTDAARHACRMATYQGSSNAALQTQVEQILKYNGYIPKYFQVGDVKFEFKVNGSTKDVSTAQMNDLVSVRLAIPYSKIKWLVNVQYLTSDDIWSESFVMLRHK